MNRLRLTLIVFVAVGAGCTSKSSPHVSKPIPRPPIEVSHEARQVLNQIATEQKLSDWWLRFDLVWRRPELQLEVHMVRKPPGENDVVYDADGVRCVVPKELTDYLKHVRVDWLNEEPKGRFDFSFDNQTPAEREAGRKWLREEEERRKKADAKPK
jgi:Fe-S cluster assembly iron-binding protein IscA